ncbi:hypothetical protein PFICI_04171 [Pestalotiopsis fici W106-1]|uniref:Ribosomal RNA-processing protein 15 n=1 Tax=Pestalotiopsis fici (strain W106-1 / CGMCC3.15140) TaxID=1229662 RepID=W3XLK8_PESFW|nr:uncharacterized protein PFICI_04171 [Pestalotiopsis fici W106-1]ETS86146.1 hypothetical protein PFICI_04171 [Pestalotiopsis fici W106-1]
MAPLKSTKKRSHHDSSTRSKASRPNKKQKKQPVYQSESEDESSFKPVNLMDSDDEGGLDVVVDDAGDLSGSDADSQSDSASENEDSARDKLGRPKKSLPKASKRKLAQDAPSSSDDDAEGEGNNGNSDEDDEDDDGDSFDLEGSDNGDESVLGGNRKSKSKRNDPAAFATSLQKILGTKLSTARRSDPVLSRSVDAQKASKEIIDAALEAKARKQMRAQKLAAKEKGRVKDVIAGSGDNTTGEPQVSTGEIREKEKQLRRAATRGVKEVFNAFLRAQQAGMDAEAQARKDGFTGVEGRKEKVSEMSRKGFLDLIANGGGKLKKGGIEEA